MLSSIKSINNHYSKLFGTKCKLYASINFKSNSTVSKYL